MNFAYLDARSLLESVLAPQPEPVEPIPQDLEPRWIEFKKTLAEFKTEYVRARKDLTLALSELNEKREEINIVKMMMENVSSSGLKERLVEMVQAYENQSNITDLTRACGELSGRCNAMKEALYNTDAEKYGKFTCFVCMDQLVDLFMDPCGHVMCERCWTNTRDRSSCPGCRTPLTGARKIYNM